MPQSLIAVQSEEDAEVAIRRRMADWNLRNLFLSKQRAVSPPATRKRFIVNPVKIG